MKTMTPQERSEYNALALYEFLVNNKEQAFTKIELLDHVAFEVPKGKSYASVFSSAIKKARSMAEDDGLFIPDAVPGNGSRYVLTDDPNRATRSLITTVRRHSGSARRKKNHMNFVNLRTEKLQPEAREIFSRWQDADERVEKYQQNSADERLNFFEAFVNLQDKHEKLQEEMKAKAQDEDDDS